MKYSLLFGKTSKNAPRDAVYASHKLLDQAGYVRESTAGRYFFLPLGQIVQQNIMKIIKEEMDATGAQEMVSPVLHPLSLWKETNRTKTVAFELMAIKDRRDAEFALGGTAEEMFVDVVRKFQMSYKDLPINIYQFSTKFRDELRARGGLLRVREFIMKDAYSFDRNESEFRKVYKTMEETYSKIFTRLGLETVIVESDNGYIGGDYCHEFVVVSEAGESKFLQTEDGSYAAHEEVAVFEPDIKNTNEPLKEMREVEAVRGTTMKDGADVHDMPMWQQIKDVVFVDDRGRFILAIIRGDFDVNEVKLARRVKAISLRHATDEEIRSKLGSEPGFISPVGIRSHLAKDVELVIVADPSLRTIVNAYGGANKKNRDLFNMNIDRDYSVDIESDIALAKEGFTAKNGKPLIAKRGIEVGNIFQLGHYYTDKMAGAVFTDSDGTSKAYYMGCYGIGICRTMAAIVEVHHDERGIVWPQTVTPYQVHLAGLDLNDPAIAQKAEEVYETLKAQGVTVLFDDRPDISPGAKFADSDLIGIPWRLVVSKKTGDNIEIKKRGEKAFKLHPIDEIISILRKN